MLIAHYNESGALRQYSIVAALLVLVLPCRATSTSETHTAGATNAAPPTASSPPNTGYRIPNTEPPLLPQPVPLSSIKSLLDFARHSACRDAARAIEDGNINLALASLDTLTAGAFHWRGAVTNGYQQGFFVNALRGYCLERAGDIVKAYRAYQNSRACFHDEAVAMQCPEPRLEVFLGLGRTCLVAGRYTDAFNWLDLVRLEGSAEPRIAAAADRGLIRRAVEIGDFYEAITNYMDLESQVAALNSQVSKTSTPVLRHSSTPGSTDPTSQVLKNSRTPNLFCLTREEAKKYAQLLFDVMQDRQGFAKLLDGLSLLGIDNNLGSADPIPQCIMNNLARANKTEVTYFYNLLGLQIKQARAAKGDEAYLAWLCKARKIISDVYGMSGYDTDLIAIRRRIDEVKEYAMRHPVLVPITNMSRIAIMPSRKYVASHNPTSSDDCVLSNATTGLEDQIMQGDYYRRCSGSSILAYECYENARRTLVTHPAICLTYDGLSASRSLQVGIADLAFPVLFLVNSQSPRITNPVFEIETALAECDWSLPRYSCLLIYNRLLKANYDVIRRAPSGHYETRGLLDFWISRETNSESIITLYDSLGNIRYVLPRIAYTKAAGALIATDNIPLALDTLLDAQQYYGANLKILHLFGRYLYLASETQKERYRRIKNNISIAQIMLNSLAGTNDPRITHLIAAPIDETGQPNELANLDRALASGNTNDAVNLSIRSLDIRNILTKRFLGCRLVVYPNQISNKTRELLADCRPDVQQAYLACVARSTHPTASNELSTVSSILISSRKESR